MSATFECSVCKKRGTFKCGICGTTYCSRECQMIDWKSNRHSEHCVEKPQFVGVRNPEVVDRIIDDLQRRVTNIEMIIETSRSREGALSTNALSTNATRGKRIPIFMQDIVSSFPSFETLKEYGISFREIKSPNEWTAQDPQICLYVVLNSSRLETVSINPNKLETLIQSRPTSVAKIIILAMKPGTSQTVFPVYELSDKTPVITLWFTPHGQFDHESNAESYARLRTLL